MMLIIEQTDLWQIAAHTSYTDRNSLLNDCGSLKVPRFLAFFDCTCLGADCVMKGVSAVLLATGELNLLTFFSALPCTPREP